MPSSTLQSQGIPTEQETCLLRLHRMLSSHTLLRRRLPLKPVAAAAVMMVVVVVVVVVVAAVVVVRLL